MEEFRSSTAFPYYLTENERVSLASALKDFSDKSNLYTSNFPAEILQGDCFDKVPYYDYVRNATDFVRVLIVSNSCDIDPSNKRDLPASVTYAPVIRLSDYEAALKRAGVSSSAMTSKVIEIKRQAITNILFLPSGQKINEDCLVLLDRAFSIPYSAFAKSEHKTKTFSLNQLGHYLLCFKLSVHFCRLHEVVSRG